MEGIQGYSGKADIRFIHAVYMTYTCFIRGLETVKYREMMEKSTLYTCFIHDA